MDTGKNKNGKKGFTLVEILVVLVIFSIMLTAITSIFVSGIRTQQNSIAQEQLLDQLNYAVDYMGRAIRMAKKTGDNNDCDTQRKYFNVTDGSANKLGFFNNKGECVYFKYIGADYRLYKGDKTSNGFPLTSDNIKITKVDFTVSGGAADGGKQPKVTILIEAESKNGNPLQKVRVQTTISARDLNKEE